MTNRLAWSCAAATTLACASLGCSTGGTPGVASPRAARLPTSDRAADLCAGLPEMEQERPSFLREDRIEDVRPVVADRAPVKFAAPALLGAEIVLRPDPSVTKHWVTRVLRCHLADPIGLAVHGTFEDPLLVGMPAVSLTQTSDHLVLRIAGRDGAQGEEILRRAEQLRRPDERD